MSSTANTTTTSSTGVNQATVDAINSGAAVTIGTTTYEAVSGEMNISVRRELMPQFHPAVYAAKEQSK